MQSNTRLYGLDHLRALAITLVFVYHYGRLFASPQWLTYIGKFGWTGVDLFFVLSGYLIASQLFKEENRDGSISLRKFYLKRLFRILPPYLVVLAVYFLLPLFREREALAPLWKYLTFTQNIGLDLRYQGTFSHAWSLCIEEQFYLMLPLVILALAALKLFRKAWLLLLCLFLGGFVVRALCWTELVAPYEDNIWINWYKWIYYPTYTRLDGLLTGISIAALFQFKPALAKRLQRYGNLLLVTGVLLLAAAYFVCARENTFAASVFGFPLVSIGYGFMVLAALCPSGILHNWSSQVTTRIAMLSYSIYLTHKIVIHLTQQYFSLLNIEKDTSLMFLISIAICIMVGAGMQLLVEKPFQQLRNRIVNK